MTDATTKELSAEELEAIEGGGYCKWPDPFPPPPNPLEPPPPAV